jgi:hypothetical protein
LLELLTQTLPGPPPGAASAGGVNADGFLELLLEEAAAGAELALFELLEVAALELGGAAAGIGGAAALPEPAAEPELELVLLPYHSLTP